MIFLDTDACIEILRDRRALADLLQKYKDERFGITAPSIFELYLGAYRLKYLKKSLAPRQAVTAIRDINDLMKKLRVQDLCLESASLGANIFMKLKSMGMEIDPFDCMIAAVVLLTGDSKILTNNRNHFKNIEGVVLVEF
jgi:predicted nucleic acid-binding protein